MKKLTVDEFRRLAQSSRSRPAANNVIKRKLMLAVHDITIREI